MKIYEFRHDTGPYENDISFRFHISKGDKFNGNIMNMVYHHFANIINKLNEESRISLRNMSDEARHIIDFIKTDIEKREQLLKEVESLCNNNKWQDFYNPKKDLVVYQISTYSKILIVSEQIASF